MKVYYIANTPKGEVELKVFHQKAPKHSFRSKSIAKGQWHFRGKVVTREEAFEALLSEES